MSEHYRDTDEASDLRFNVSVPGVSEARWSSPELDQAQQLIEHTRPGLTFKTDQGAVFLDLGRRMADHADNMDTLDLRVMLAHLDAAARAIQLELAERDGR